MTKEHLLKDLQEEWNTCDEDYVTKEYTRFKNSIYFWEIPKPFCPSIIVVLFKKYQR